MTISYLTSYLNPFAYFDQKSGSLSESVLMTWQLDGKTVQLIRSENQLIVELIFSFKSDNRRKPINIPQHLSIEEAIERLINMDVIVDENNQVNFVQKSGFWNFFSTQNEKKISRLDSSSILDNDHWAVTLADTGASRSYPTTWGGHAVLFVETVKNNEYQVLKMHLMKNSTNEDFFQCKIDIEKIKNFIFNKIKSKTVTWVRSKNLIQQMIDNISNQQLALTKGEKPCRMNLRGQNALGVGKAFHNCFTWARKQLEIAKIHLWDPESMISPPVIRPNAYISPDAPTSKERIIVQIDGANLKLDITQEIDALVKHRPWKLPLNDIGEPWTVIMDGKVDLQKEEPLIELKDQWNRIMGGDMKMQAIHPTAIHPTEIRIIGGDMKIQVINATEIIKKIIKTKAFQQRMLDKAKKVDNFIMNYTFEDNEGKEQNTLAHSILEKTVAIGAIGVGLGFVSFGSIMTGSVIILGGIGVYTTARKIIKYFYK